MANLTQNLDTLQKGKKKIIDKINSKLFAVDQEQLDITCRWDEINELLAKVKVKKDRSSELDASEIYTEICNDTRNKEIVTNVTTIGQYSLYGQCYLPKLIANSCTSISTYALFACTALTEVSLPVCTTIEGYAFYNTTSLKSINLPKLASLGSYAFYQSGIEAATLGNVTAISSCAFYGCSKLKTITASKVTSINSEAFYGDALLETANFGSSYFVSNYAFYDCVALKDTILTNCTSIGNYAFYNCKSFLTFSNDTVTSIGELAFCGCEKLETVSLSKITTLTSGKVFAACAALRSVVLPNVTTIGYVPGNWNYSTFFNLPNLESLYLPKANTVYNLCYNCGIKTLSLPALVSRTMRVYDKMVSDCPNLESVDLSNLQYTKATNNNSNPLIYNCWKLKEINLSSWYGAYDSNSWTSASVNSYYINLLSNTGIEKLSLPRLRYLYPYYGSYISNSNKCLTELDVSNLQVCNHGYDHWWNGPKVIIGGHPKLTKIKFDSLSYIKCYYGYSWLYPYVATSSDRNFDDPQYMEAWMQYYKDIDPTSYESIASYKMYFERRYGGIIGNDYSTADFRNPGTHSGRDSNGCWFGFTELSFPKLSYWYFYANPYYGFITSPRLLEKITFGDGTFIPTTTSISTGFISGANNLRQVVLNYPVVITASTSLSNVFYDCPHLTGTQLYFDQTVNGVNKRYYYANEAGLKDLYFYVPDNLVESYKTASNWSTYADQIKPISELADLNIDSTITEIEEEKYKDNKTLTTVAGFGITKIGAKSFYNTSATSLLFSNLKEIGNYAFAESTDLSSVTINEVGATYVGEGAYMSTKIDSIRLPLLTIINNNTFKNCINLTSATLAAVKVINESAFENSGLTSISYSTLLKINKDAFKNCNSLKTATLPIVTNIGESAFENAALTTLSLPLATVIQKAAFKGNSLTSISLPKIMIIGDEAFANNADLTEINLYEAMQIGNNVFDGCTVLTSITFTGYTVPVCGDIPSTCTLHVRSEMVTDFEEVFPENTIVGDVA